MTNEQICDCLAANPGRKDLIAELYKKNVGMIRKQANLFSYSTDLDFDDLVQEGYFCMLAALAAYDKNAGYRFIIYLKNALRWRYMRILKGERHNESLDSPLPFDKTLTMHDVIQDKSVDVEGDYSESFFMSEVCQDLQKAIGELSETDRKVIYLRYHESKTYSEIATERGYKDADKAGYAIQKALHHLRRAPILKKWEPYFSDKAEAAAYQHIGVAGYQRNKLSSTERAAFKDLGIRI